MLMLLGAQTAEEGGGTSINVGVIALIAVALIAVVVFLRRRRSVRSRR
jgi:Flp pilus assembly pilin Flp